MGVSGCPQLPAPVGMIGFRLDISHCGQCDFKFKFWPPLTWHDDALNFKLVPWMISCGITVEFLYMLENI